MRTLLLMRHGKSSWEDSGLSDRERPLARRGRRDTPRMARFLIANRLLPGTIFCSPTVRTRQTLELILEAAPAERRKEISISYFDSIYEGDVDELIGLLRRCHPATKTLLMIGHNPLLTYLTEILIGKKFPHPKFSTAAIAILKLSIDEWSGIRKGCARLTDFIRPKCLDDA